MWIAGKFKDYGHDLRRIVKGRFSSQNVYSVLLMSAMKRRRYISTDENKVSES